MWLWILTSPQVIFLCLITKEPRPLEDQQRSLGECPRAHLSMIFLLSPELWEGCISPPHEVLLPWDNISDTKQAD